MKIHWLVKYYFIVFLCIFLLVYNIENSEPNVKWSLYPRISETAVSSFIEAKNCEELKLLYTEEYNENYETNFFGFVIRKDKLSIRGLNLISNLNCVKNSLKKNLSCIPHNNNLNYFVGIAYNSYADQPELAINFLNNYIVNYSLKDSFSLDKVYYDLSQIYEKKKDINMAISYLDKAVKINPKFKIAISKKEQILERNER